MTSDTTADPRVTAAIQTFGRGSGLRPETLQALAYTDLGTPRKLLAFPPGELWRIRGLGGKALDEIRKWTEKTRRGARDGQHCSLLPLPAFPAASPAHVSQAGNVRLEGIAPGMARSARQQ